MCQCDYFMTAGKFSRLLEGVLRDNCVFSLEGLGGQGGLRDSCVFWRGVWVGREF